MPDTVIQSLSVLVQLLELVGAVVLILGFILATKRWVQNILRLGMRSAIYSYRQELGRSILIGLEILVAATIIKTISVNPSLQNMSYLAVMVVIRTIIGWTTVLEIYGHWPWQKANT